MIPINESKVVVLTPYMEVIGQIVELEEQEGVLLVEIAKYIIVLPIEMKEILSPHLGNKIAILRTDIPCKEYLFRVIAERDSDIGQGTGQPFTHSRCEGKQPASCSEVI
jgi:hypothetical protein